MLTQRRLCAGLRNANSNLLLIIYDLSFGSYHLLLITHYLAKEPKNNNDVKPGTPKSQSPTSHLNRYREIYQFASGQALELGLPPEVLPEPAISLLQ